MPFGCQVFRLLAQPRQGQARVDGEVAGSQMYVTDSGGMEVGCDRAQGEMGPGARGLLSSQAAMLPSLLLLQLEQGANFS